MKSWLTEFSQKRMAWIANDWKCAGQQVKQAGQRVEDADRIRAKSVLRQFQYVLNETLTRTRVKLSGFIHRGKDSRVCYIPKMRYSKQQNPGSAHFNVVSLSYSLPLSPSLFVWASAASSLSFSPSCRQKSLTSTFLLLSLLLSILSYDNFLSLFL